MPIGLAFWVIMLIWLVFGLLTHFGIMAVAWAVTANAVLLFILFFLLGWKVFGFMLHE